MCKTLKLLSGNNKSFSTHCFQMRHQSQPNQRSSSARSTRCVQGKKDRSMANNSTKRQGRTGFQSDPPQRTNISPLDPDFTSRTCFLIHLHTLWSEQCTMTCRTQTPSGKLMHELFPFIPLVPWLVWSMRTQSCTEQEFLRRPSNKRCSHNHLAWNEAAVFAKSVGGEHIRLATVQPGECSISVIVAI